MTQESVFKNKRFLFIIITVFLSVLGIGLIIPVVPFMLTEYVDPSKTAEIAWHVGLLTSIYSLCQFFAAPVLGALSDRFGRRPVLLWCLFGSAIGYIMFGVGGALWVLYLSRIIDGLTGGDISTVFAYIADISKPQDRGKYYGIVGATVGFGFILGPTLGGLLAHISLTAPFFIAAAITFANMLFGFFVLPESLDKEHRMSDFSLHHLNPFTQFAYILKNSLLKALLIVGIFYFLPFAQLQSITTVFLKDSVHWGPSQIGFLFLILGLGDMFTQGFLSGKLLPKYGELKLVFAGFFLTGLAYALYVVVGNTSQALFVYIAILVYALGSGLFEPAMGGLVSRTAQPQEQGRVQGANQSMQSITRIIGPLIAAFLYQFGIGIPYITCVILSALGMLILWQKRAYIQGHLIKQEASW